MARLNWRGKEVVAKVKTAAARGIDQTTALCVNGAKSEHQWVNRTGTLEGSTQMRPAVIKGASVIGRWGSFSVNYAIFLETDPRFIFLRPQADRHYPGLAALIRANMG